MKRARGPGSCSGSRRHGVRRPRLTHGLLTDRGLIGLPDPSGSLVPLRIERIPSRSQDYPSRGPARIGICEPVRRFPQLPVISTKKEKQKETATTTTALFGWSRRAPSRLPPTYKAWVVGLSGEIAQQPKPDTAPTSRGRGARGHGGRPPRRDPPRAPRCCRRPSRCERASTTVPCGRRGAARGGPPRRARAGRGR